MCTRRRRLDCTLVLLRSGGALTPRPLRAGVSDALLAAVAGAAAADFVPAAAAAGVWAASAVKSTAHVQMHEHSHTVSERVRVAARLRLVTACCPAAIPPLTAAHERAEESTRAAATLGRRRGRTTAWSE